MNVFHTSFKYKTKAKEIREKKHVDKWTKIEKKNNASIPEDLLPIPLV